VVVQLNVHASTTVRTVELNVPPLLPSFLLADAKLRRDLRVLELFETTRLRLQGVSQ
jgi:hypothetical protein